MRASNTYRGARRNKAKSDRFKTGYMVWDGLQREGSKGKAVTPTHTLFIPPVRKNKALRHIYNEAGEILIEDIRHKRTMIRWIQDEIPEVRPEPEFNWEKLGEKEAA